MAKCRIWHLTGLIIQLTACGFPWEWFNTTLMTILQSQFWLCGLSNIKKTRQWLSVNMYLHNRSTITVQWGSAVLCVKEVFFFSLITLAFRGRSLWQRQAEFGAQRSINTQLWRVFVCCWKGLVTVDLPHQFCASATHPTSLSHEPHKAPTVLQLLLGSCGRWVRAWLRGKIPFSFSQSAFRYHDLQMCQWCQRHKC